VAADAGVCSPGCTGDDQCAVLGKCAANGICVAPEDCADTSDNDGDGLTDCEDPECAEACADSLGAACGGTPASPQVTTGDTVGKTHLFAGSCTGAAGATEQVFSYTPAADGTLVAKLDSMTDQGMYIRTACADGGTEIACTDFLGGGATESLFVAVKGGTPLAIFVDGYDKNQAGPFSLDLTLLQPVQETEANNSASTSDMAGGGLVGGSITPMGDEDFFQVNVPGPSSTLRVLTIPGGSDQCGPKGKIDTQIDILDGGGMTSLSTSDDIGPVNFCSATQAAGLAAGSYYVRVRASKMFCPDCTFDYGVLIEVM
jgi:hypothetical protein